MSMPAPRPVAQNQVPNVAELIDRLSFWDEGPET